ncbi:class I SAM-dependent methyltransferase [Streptomyces halstedii]|uniref:class I SAM-dependent methyltransferase n=1 Tax=Streptomyces halstedii TaxID=1944 RepID=UPI0036AFBFBF
MTSPAHLTAVRESYDTLAADYFAQVPPVSGMDPLNRGMPGVFAELVRADGSGPVADLGCGPGRTTAHLAGLGLSAFGVDLSPKMVEVARRNHPGLHFTEGSMACLDIASGTLGGIMAWYSVHHTPPGQLPDLFGEFHRVLAPGGRVLIGDWTGTGEEVVPGPVFGHPVSYRNYFLPLSRLVELLTEAGLDVTAHLEQEPDGRFKRRHACVLARKPPARIPAPITS